MSALTKVGNQGIQGDVTTLATGDIDKINDQMIIYDTSAAALKRVSATGLGGGKFLGEGVGGAGDIIRVHEQQLDTSVEVLSGENGLAAGPLTIADGVTLTISGNLSIV